MLTADIVLDVMFQRFHVFVPKSVVIINQPCIPNLHMSRLDDVLPPYIMGYSNMCPAALCYVFDLQ